MQYSREFATIRWIQNAELMYGVIPKCFPQKLVDDIVRYLHFFRLFYFTAEFECFVCILPNIDVSIVCVKDKTHVLLIFSK